MAFPARHAISGRFSVQGVSLSSAGSSSPEGRGRLRAIRAGRARQPRPPPGPPQRGQRGAVTSNARPRPTRALQFIETLLALKLIIHHSLSISEQGLYLRSSRFNHLVSNCFELLPHGQRGGEGERETVTVTSVLRKAAEGPLGLSPYANPAPSAAGLTDGGASGRGSETRGERAQPLRG